jgi:hypothetical protein
MTELNLHLQRNNFDLFWTIGALSIDGTFECHTLEDMDRKMESGGLKVFGQTAIPRGRYKIILDFSQRFKRVLPRLLGVPFFDSIRIHSGNTSENTEGCILVGRTMRPGFVGESKLALESLMIKLINAKDEGKIIWITIE